MTAINIVTVITLVMFALLVWAVLSKKNRINSEWSDYLNDVAPSPEVIKVKDIDIGHAIYDIFPEWREEFQADPMMDEIAATCDLYLAAKELLKGGTADVKLIVSLDDAVRKFEKYAL